jgi:glycosyltransferase involved in cell wall biosynthesis
MKMEARRKRVLVLTSQFPNPVDPVRGIFSGQLVAELARICDVTVVSPLPWFPRWAFLRQFARWYALSQVPYEYQVQGVQVYAPKYAIMPRVSGPLHGALVFAGMLATVWKLHRKLRFDVISAMWLYPDSVAAGWVARLLRIPMVPAALGCDVNRMLHESGKRRQILSMLRRAPAIIAVSEALRERMALEGVPAARISTVPNGVNGELFYIRDRKQARAELGLPQDRKIVVYVGRLSEEKGLLTLIDAAGRLRQCRDDFLLCLVGGGPQLHELQARVESLGLAREVRFAGPQEHPAVANWLGACDVFCLPSLREGCPNVVLEALSSGRPIVASRVGGIPDLVRDDTGILVEPEDSEGFAGALDEALARPWSERLIAESMSGHTWRAAAENYHAVFRDAISAGARAS